MINKGNWWYKCFVVFVVSMQNTQEVKVPATSPSPHPQWCYVQVHFWYQNAFIRNNLDLWT